MSLVAGTRLGPYEIQSAIGAGGMGEVYKARDTRLDRTVAIKVLPPDVSADPDRRARFEREAKTVAGVNHAHICTLYDVGDHAGAMFLVMEYLAGQTLAERLEKGPLPLEQALTVATEIADALSAAHRQGVIHRDLKPANVMLTKGGAKLLDFGLAKLTGHGEQPAAAYAVSAVPTQAATLTGQGVIVGTLQYMAPEQLEGKPPDARTDLWALGAILYEMVSGKRAFEGTSVVSVMSNIMNAEPPPIASLQPLTPAALDRLVKRCLGKSPDDRPDSAHDVAEDLRWLRETSGSQFQATPKPRARRWRRVTATAVVSLASAVVGAGALWFISPPNHRSGGIVRSWLDVAPATRVTSGQFQGVLCPTPGGSSTAFTWAADGRALVFVGRQETDSLGGALAKGQLYVRWLDRPEAYALAGTAGARAPVVSRDGMTIAFWARGAIRRVSVSGGPVTTLVERVPAAPARIAWARSGRLFYDDFAGALWQADAQGTPSAVSRVQGGGEVHSLPALADDDRVLLYTVVTSVAWGTELLVAQVLATGERTVVQRQATDARYLPTGHLVFMRNGVLWAAPFDAARRAVRADPQPLQAGIAQALVADSDANKSGAGQFSISPTGTLAFIPGEVGSYPEQALVSVDLGGRVKELPVRHMSFGNNVRRCGEGPYLLMDYVSTTDSSVWRHDLSHPQSLEKVWSERYFWTCMAGDSRVAYVRGDGPGGVLWRRTSDGPEEVLVPKDLWPVTWAPGGRRLILTSPDVHQLWAYAMDGPEPRLRPLTDVSNSQVLHPTVSPDGQWLAFTSDATGRLEIYLQPFPGPGERTQITFDGGANPAWSPRGHELFFVTYARSSNSCRSEKPENGACMNTVQIDLTGRPRAGRPRQLFAFNQRELAFGCQPARCYELSADGMSFYALRGEPPPPAPPVTHINLVTNWFDELKAKVPPAR